MITSTTCLYCVLGNPVVHSKSPLIHNAAFKDLGINAVYLAFSPENTKAAVRTTMDAIRTLNIGGASVTIPFKEVIMPYLDRIDTMAQTIGAVNTIVNREGRLTGYNTDCEAAIAPLRPFGIKGKTVCIVGAGGAARAVAHGIAAEGGKVVVVNRTQEKGRALAGRVGGTFVPVDRAAEVEAQVVINTTSLGMAPDTQTLSFPESALHPGTVVMDVVYTPMDTCLLKTARAKGCTTIDGLSMFVAQAAAQFTLWTGQHPDIELMKRTVLENALGDL